MTVYFIGGDFDRVKIGFTADATPEARLMSLQVGSPVPLRVLAFAPGDEALEKALHKAFKHVRVQGEWFVASAALVELVARVAETGSLAGWGALLQHPALRWAPIPEAMPSVLGSMPARPQLAAPPWSELIASWPSDSDDAHIEHQVHDEFGFGSVVGWRKRGSDGAPSCRGRSGLAATGEALILASGSRDREAAAWILACLFEAGPQRISRLWCELPKRLPLFDEIASAAREVFSCEWHSASTEAFPVRFSLDGHMGVSPSDFVGMVIQHRARVWSEYGLFAAWSSGISGDLRDAPRRAGKAAA